MSKEIKLASDGLMANNGIVVRGSKNQYKIAIYENDLVVSTVYPEYEYVLDKDKFIAKTGLTETDYYELLKSVPYANRSYHQEETVTNWTAGTISSGPSSTNSEGALAAFNKVWLTDYDNANLLRIDPSTALIDMTITVGTNPWGICSDGTYLWVAHSSSPLLKINPSTGSIISTLSTIATGHGICSDETYVWVANYDATISKINVSTDTIIATITVGATNTNSMIFAGGYVWVGCLATFNIYKVDPSTNAVTTYAMDSGTEANFTTGEFAYDGTYLWVRSGNTTTGEFRINKVNISDGSVIDYYVTNDDYRFIAYDGHNIWLAEHTN